MKRWVEKTDLLMLCRDIQINNTSGHPGVVWHKRDKRWLARIKFQGKTHHLGSFSHKDDAIACRKRAEQQLFNPMLARYEDEIMKGLEQWHGEQRKRNRENYSRPYDHRPQTHGPDSGVEK
jgi:hypothetical protein